MTYTQQQARRLLALLPVLEAAADGKTIQMRTPTGWKDRVDLSFVGDIEQYRVKPEPRRLFGIVRESDGKIWAIMKDKDQAIKSMDRAHRHVGWDDAMIVPFTEDLVPEKS